MSDADALMRRQFHAVGFGWSSTVPDDSGNVQTVQVEVNDAQTIDRVPVVHPYGFSSCSPIGSVAVRVSVSGIPSSSVALAMVDQKKRARGLTPGQSLQYDDAGCRVFLPATGQLHLFAPGEALRRLMTEVAMEVFNQHTHPANGAPPTQQMGDAHLTGGLRGGGPA